MSTNLKLAFYTNPQRENAVQSLTEALNTARAMGCECFVSPALDGLSGLTAPVIGAQAPDFIIALGGDGTILRAARSAAAYVAPVLGVNFGRVGFLSEVAPDGLEQALLRLIAGDYTTDDRTMLACSVNGGEAYAYLNDALLYKRSFSGVVDITMEIDGLSAGSVLCDGIIVSTSTGATGYSISAGGPVIAPGLDAVIITPICPHTLTVRPIIAGSDAKLRFSMKSEGYISLDGIYTAEVDREDEIRIFRGGERVEFVRFGRQNVYELIRHKLA